jgi:transcriptional regulator with XRE-family HTH domain
VNKPSRQSIAPLGAQIRALRASRSLTLKELADRVGTSAPAMHRYEGLWEGYTLSTLRRIADALDADLMIRLKPRDRGLSGRDGTRRPTPRAFMREVGNLFWDVDLREHHLDEPRNWVITRIMNEGRLPQVRAALAYFGFDHLDEVLERRDLSPRARSFLRALLAERHACTHKS